MNIEMAAKALSNRINQPHYVKSIMQQVYNLGLRTGKEWSLLEHQPPICFESGDWDGLKSEPFLCRVKNSENVFIGVAYEVIQNGSNFFDVYDNNTDSLINSSDLEWRSLLL